MPGATVTVVYPPGSFNMDYYLSTHMPLVSKKWGPHGLKSWKVIKFGDDAPYQVQATLEFDSMADFKKAGGSPEAKEVMGDIPNFTDTQPTILAGDVMGTS